MKHIGTSLFTLALALASSAALPAPLVQPFSSEVYARDGSSKAVVILAANWGRKRHCGDHDAVRLHSFSFDKLGSKPKSSKAPADFLMQVEAGGTPPERFLPYVKIIEPGEYHLSSFAIDTMDKTDAGGEKMGRLSVKRKQLVKGSKYIGGKFSAAAGEVVYLGHFFLSCDSTTEPALLRYQISEGEQFDRYLNAILTDHKPLEPAQVKYRPFESEKYGVSPDSK